VADIIQLRRDNASNWSAVNPVLAQGEMGFEIDGLKAKIGNGLSSYNDLSYLVGFGASMVISAGSNSTDLGTVYFSNANGITFGMDTSGVITASHNGLTVQTGNFASTDHVHIIYPLNSLFSGTNISGTINATAFNLSVAAAPTILAAHAGTAFSGTNISGTVNSTVIQLSVASPVASGNSTSFGYQSATPSQTTGATSVLANNGAWVTVITTQSGNFLSTNAGSDYVNNSLFAGTNISGTINSSAFNLSVAAQSGNFLTTAASSNYVINSLFSGTNISGTINSSAFALSVAAPAVITGLVAASTFTGTNIIGTVNSGGWTIQGAVGTGFSGTNISGTLNATGLALNVADSPAILAAHVGTQFSGTNISGTVNSTALQLNVAAAPTILGAHAGTAFSGTNISATLNSTAVQLSVAASGNSTSFGFQSATPSQTTGASSVLANNGGWVAVLTNTTAYIVTGGSTSFGSQSATPSQTSGATSVLANNGAWVTVITTVGNNDTGFVLAGNTSGSSSFWFTANEKQTYAATWGLYVSGTSNNALTYGVQPVSNVEDPDMWWNMATTYSSAISTGSMFVRPFRIEWPIQFSVIDYPMSFNLATTNSSVNFSLAHTVVIYSLNAGGTGLAPIVGNTGATVLTFTSGNNAMSLNGPRIISQTMASTIFTPGDYWFGVQHNWAITSGAATSSHSWGPMLVSMPASTIFPAWSASSTATGTIMVHRPWQGAAPLIATSKGTDGTSVVITIANMVVGSTQGYRANIPIRLKNITY
jgi:hypothetical protein